MIESPKALNADAIFGMRIVLIPHKSANEQQWVAPAPPNAIKAQSKGSILCILVMDFSMIPAISPAACFLMRSAASSTVIPKGSAINAAI